MAHFTGCTEARGCVTDLGINDLEPCCRLLQGLGHCGWRSLVPPSGNARVVADSFGIECGPRVFVPVRPGYHAAWRGCLEYLGADPGPRGPPRNRHPVRIAVE